MNNFPVNAKVIVLLLVSPVIALVALVLVGSIVGKYFRKQCPACLQRSLKKVSFVRAETIIEGMAQPDYRTYLRCEKCGERFKLHDGILTGVPADEMTDAMRFG